MIDTESKASPITTNEENLVVHQTIYEKSPLKEEMAWVHSKVANK